MCNFTYVMLASPRAFSCQKGKYLQRMHDPSVRDPWNHMLEPHTLILANRKAPGGLQAPKTGHQHGFAVSKYNDIDPLSLIKTYIFYPILNQN